MQESMQAQTGYVISEQALAMQPVTAENASYRIPIDRSVGCQNLIQRVFCYGPGQFGPQTNEVSEDILYVVSGTGEAIIDGNSHSLAPATGLYVPPESIYFFVNPGPADLVMVSVLSPQPGQMPVEQADASPHPDGKMTTTEAEESPIPAGNRTFKFMINHRFGCHNVTQFVGFIPPGKAPFHNHTYEEVIYILEGDGIVHIGDQDFPVQVRSSIYLPPLLRHCIENTAETPLRLLGVFCPAGDPGSKASEDK